MPREQDPPGIRAARRRYGRRLAMGIAVYAVLLVVTIVALESGDLAQPLRYAVALLPMLGVLPIPLAVLRLVRDSDELQRRLQLEALAVAFGAGSVLTFGYGFLQLAGAPDVSWLFVWPVYALCWAVAGIAASRRYRADGEG